MILHLDSHLLLSHGHLLPTLSPGTNRLLPLLSLLTLNRLATRRILAVKLHFVLLLHFLKDVRISLLADGVVKGVDRSSL